MDEELNNQQINQNNEELNNQQTGQEEDEQYFIKPYNPLDPVLVFKPELESKMIIKPVDLSHNPSIDKEATLKDDGINIPIVRINNFPLSENQIDYVKLSFVHFLPQIHLSIKDIENVIRICDAPGYDNEIHIVITSQINGYYKKISLLFYITNFEPYDEYLAYDGILKLQSLNSDQLKQIGKGKLNTYELLELIAKENKLGYQTTEGCKDIKDERYRIIQSKTYEDFINDQLLIGGIDDKSIFDAWIDMYNYITLVDIKHIFDEKIDPKQLVIYSMVGLNVNLSDENDLKPIKLSRTLTNNRINTTNTNLEFNNNYEKIINNNQIYNNGSLSTNWYMLYSHAKAKIDKTQIQLIENSVDGVENSQNYEFNKIKFLGIDFSETPTLIKKEVNKRYFDKIRSNQIKIELVRYNLGLQRGMLVYLAFIQENATVISIMSPKDKDEGTLNKYEPYNGESDLFTSGLYYIDAIEFEYKTENHKIQEYLYLIKKDPIIKPINNVTGPPIARKLQTQEQLDEETSI